MLEYFALQKSSSYKRKNEANNHIEFLSSIISSFINNNAYDDIDGFSPVVKPSFLMRNQNLEIPSHFAINGSGDFIVMSSSGPSDVTNGNL